MKIVFYNVRIDEADLVRTSAEKYHVDVEVCHEILSRDNIHLCQGAYAISITTKKLNEELIKILHQYGVSYISTRTIGYDHIDLEACQKYHIHVGNVSYTSNSVAEYTVMTILMSLRKMQAILRRYQIQNFSLYQVRGQELKGLTVGIIGTGKIGRQVIQLLSGFSVNVIAYDQYPQNDDIHYVELSELYAKSDIISIHVPYSQKTHHFLDQESFEQMKDQVMIINTARGSLIDTNALIDALKSGKVKYAALDVMENETNYYYRDCQNQIIDHDALQILRSMPNVLLTPHTAFYTDQAVTDMVQNSIISAIAMYEDKENPWLIV